MIVTEQKQGLRLIFLIVTIAVTTIVVQYHTTSGTRTFWQFIDASVVWDGIGNPDNIAIYMQAVLLHHYNLIRCIHWWWLFYKYNNSFYEYLSTKTNIVLLVARRWAGLRTWVPTFVRPLVRPATPHAPQDPARTTHPAVLYTSVMSHLLT